VYTWRYLVQTYPKSADAELARKQLARMPKSALDGPMPPAAGEQGAGPTTAPTVRAD
jgi:hypothetical protein